MQEVSIVTYSHCFCIRNNAMLSCTVNWHCCFYFNTKQRCNVYDMSFIISILFAHVFNCSLADIYNAQLDLYQKNKIICYKHLQSLDSHLLNSLLRTNQRSFHSKLQPNLPRCQFFGTRTKPCGLIVPLTKFRIHPLFEILFWHL